MFFSPFWVYVGQLQDYIGWTKSMPLYQSILLTQGPIQEIFAKKFWELAILENKFFFGGHFEKKKSKIFFLFHSHVKRSKFLGSKGWFEILIITLFSSCFSPWANILHPSVYKPDFHGVSLVIFLKMGNSKIHKFSCLLKLVTSAEHKRDNLKGWELKKAQILDLL